MARMRIDETAYAVTVYCIDCGGWSELADDRDDARRRAIAHEASVHPDTRQVREAARVRAARAARDHSRS